MELFPSTHKPGINNDVVEMYQVISKYSPKAVSWRHHPLIAGRLIDSAVLQGEKHFPVTFNLTKLAKSWYGGGEANFGVLLKARDEILSGLIKFCSREWDDSRCWPMLQIEYAQPHTSGCDLTLDRTEECLAVKEWSYSSTLDVLVFEYTYVLFNRSDHAVEACLQLSMNGSEWSTNSPEQLVLPQSYEMFMPDTITRYSRLGFRTLEPGQQSKVEMHIQGRVS